MKAVIYARYSSDSQREESIEGQIRECTAFAGKNGITVLRRRHGGWAKAAVLRDVSPSRETALAIVSRLDEAQVSPLHLADAVADLLP